MLLQAQLVHAESGRRVVLVSAHDGQRLLGSALGEAPDAEQAEDRALERLLQRLGAPAEVSEGRPAAPRPVARPRQAAQVVQAAQASQPAQATLLPLAPPLEASAAPPTPTASAPSAAAEPAPPEPQPSEAQPSQPQPTEPEPGPEPAEPPPLDPDDWSSELAQLELQLQRIGWNREQEGLYLQRAFGHPSRSRITTYADLAAYLRSLEALEPGADPSLAAVPLRRRDLLSQCDQLLGQLGWEAARGRSFLEQQLGVSSRSQLSDAQLLAFNMLLEGELIAAPANCHTPGDD